MAYYADSYSTETSNVCPGGQAGAALSVGDLVYRDSSGYWQKAQSVAIGSTSPKDAEGVIIRTTLQYEFINPVKVAEIRGYSGLTIGAAQYLSGTAGAVTETEPTTTRRQKIGYARAADVIRFEVGAAATGGQAGDIGGDVTVDTLTVHCVTNDANDCHLAFQKARATAIVQSGDDLGSIDFNGFNGTTYDTAVQLLAEVAATPGASADMPGKLTVKCSADGSATPSTVATFAAAAVTIADATNIVLSATTGTKIGTAVTQKLGFFNATPAVQPANANQAAVTATTTTTATTTALETDLDALRTLVNQMRGDLVTLGIIKGAA